MADINKLREDVRWWTEELRVREEKVREAMDTLGTRQRELMQAERKNGFTLIELLVVVALISLLSSIVFASLGSARAKARDAKRTEDIHSVQLALELYYNTNGAYAPNTDSSGGPCTPSTPCNGDLSF